MVLRNRHQMQCIVRNSSKDYYYLYTIVKRLDPKIEQYKQYIYRGNDGSCVLIMAALKNLLN